MLYPKRRNLVSLAVLSLAVGAGASQAQSTATDDMRDPAVSLPPPVLMAQASTGSSPSTGGEYSLLPFTQRGYVGISVGQTRLRTPCGTGDYGCDNADSGAHIYTGGLVNDWLGAEVGYFRTASADRSGGRTRVQGFNVGAVLRAPIGAFNAYLKGGAVYAESRVTSGLLSNVSAGKERAWGPSYSVGIGYDFMPNAGIVLDWTRNQVKFAGLGDRQDVDTTSLGYVFRF